MLKLVAVLMGSLSLGMGQWLEGAGPGLQNVAVQGVPAEGRMSSEYGFRRHPIRGCHHFHWGVDIKNAHATPITATGAGRVVRVERNRGYGLIIEIEHGHGWTTRYAHLSAADVSVGDYVGQGAIVGRMGASGAATGTHLHFELRRYGFAVNPALYLQSAPVIAANDLR